MKSGNKYYHLVSYILSGGRKIITSSVNGLSASSHAERLSLQRLKEKAYTKPKAEQLYFSSPTLQER